MLGAVAGAWLAEKEIRRRGENGEAIWDAMVWVLPSGIVGARTWYILNNILGGGKYYIENPIKVFYVWEGGLHFFGGLLFGAIALYFFLKQNGFDIWLFLDAIAPAVFIGQALARPANFINQELYGQPTKLPWGIPIDAGHRLAQYADLSQFPVETTRFHPTFAYEMILNILLGLLLIWISRQYADKLKPGAVFSGWLIMAGLARSFIEFFRPDQPHIGASFVSYTMFVSFLLAVSGAVMLLARYGKLQIASAEDWEDEYKIKLIEKKERIRSRELTASTQNIVVTKPIKKKSAQAEKPSAKIKTIKKSAKKPANKIPKKITTKPKK
jgi:phosphatidylglycerol:prolipoprotein diacylglycerol transferase